MPVGEEDHSVGVGSRNRVVSDHHDGLVEFANSLRHELENLGPGSRVEVSGGFVGEDDAWSARQGPRHGDALLLATRQFVRAVVEPVLEADGADHAVEPLVVGGVARERHGQRDVLERRERRDEVERLEHEADLFATQQGEVAFGELGQILLADVDPAVAEVVEAGHAVHERRLARAGRTHDGAELRLLELDRDSIEGTHLGVARSVVLGGAFSARGSGGGRSSGGSGGHHSSSTSDAQRYAGPR